MRNSNQKMMLLAEALAFFFALPSCGKPLEEPPEFQGPMAERQKLAAKLLFSGQIQQAEVELSQLCGMPQSSLEPRAEAECLHLLGLALVFSDRPEAALKYLEDALQVLAHSDNIICFPQVLLILGSVEGKLGRFPRGLRHLEEARELFQDLFKHSAELGPNELDELGTGCLPSAVPSGKLRDHLATQVGRKAALMTHIVMAHLTLAVFWLEAGAYHETERHLEIVRPLAELFGDLFEAQTSMLNGELRYRQGRLDEARVIFEQLAANASISSSPLFSLANAYQASGTFDRLSEIAIQQGHFDKALFWNDRERERARLAQDADAEVDALGSSAMVYLSQLRLSEAQTSLREAEELARTKGSPPAQARALWMQALIPVVQGRTLDATRLLERAAKLYEGLERPSEEAMVWGMLYQLYSLANAGAAVEQEVKAASGRKNIDNAAQALIRLAQKAAKRGPSEYRGEIDSLRHAPFAWQHQALQFLELLGRVSTETPGEFPLLEVESQAASAQTSALPFFRVHFLYLEGLILLSRDEYQSARARFDRALADVRETGHKEFEGRLLVHRAVCLWKLGQKYEALEDLRASVRAYEAASLGINVPELQRRFFAKEVQSAYDVLVMALLSMGRKEEAFEVNDGSLSRALFTSLIFGTTETETSMDLRQQLERIQTLESGLGSSRERDSLLSEGRARYEGLVLRSQVLASSPEIAQALAPVSLKNIQAGLPEDTAIVEYRLFEDESRGAAWVIDRQSIEYFPLEINPAITILALKWSMMLGQPGRGTQRVGGAVRAFDRETPTLVWKMLFEPLQARIAGKSKIIVVPHDWLHYLPFGALEDYEEPLIHKFSFSYAPSAGILDLLLRRETPLAGKALVVGDPATKGRLQRLSYAASEARSVADLLGTTAILGTDATEHRFFRESPQADIIHIAAHSVDFFGHPLFSRLLLSPGAAGEDGNVETHEVLQRLELKEANLVVLAACRTALGEVDRGQEVSSLSRAFLLKGASGVVSSLWEIDDRATSILMAEFYKHLAAGLTAAEALRAAQLKLRGTPEFKDPAYWAAFVLLGSPQARWTLQ